MGRRRTLVKKRRIRTNKRRTIMRRRTINKMRGGGLPYPDDTDDINNAKKILQGLTPINNADGNDVAHGDLSHYMTDEEIMKRLRENIEKLNTNKEVVTKTEQQAQSGDTIIYKYTIKEGTIETMTLYYLHYNIIINGISTYSISCSVKAFNDLLQNNIKYILSHLEKPLTIIKTETNVVQPLRTTASEAIVKKPKAGVFSFLRSY